MASKRARLTLGADPACAELSQLEARVRSKDWQLVHEAAVVAELTLAATIRPEAGNALQVDLRVEWADGRSAERALAATSCGAAVAALALLINMTLDTSTTVPPVRSRAAGGGQTSEAARAVSPDGREGTAPHQHTGDARPAAAGGRRGRGTATALQAFAPAARGDGKEPAPSSAPAADGGRAQPSAAGAAEDATRPRTSAADAGAELAAASARQPSAADARGVPNTLAAARGGSEQPSRAHAEPAADGGEWSALDHVAVGARAALVSGTAPKLQPGLGLYAALALRGVGILRPLLQLELTHAWLSDLAAVGGRADFSFDGGQLNLCPLAVQWRALAAHGCAALEAGRLTARGHDAYQPRAQSRPWLGAGAALLLRAALWQRIELQLGAAVVRPWWRDRFAFAPQVFYAIPALGLRLQVGVAVRFP